MTQRIENSERGITLNKGLAWTVATGLIGAGLYVGITVANLSGKIDKLSGDGASTTEAIASLGGRVRELESNLDGRVRALEISRGRDDERFNNILEFLTRIDSRLERIEQSR